METLKIIKIGGNIIDNNKSLTDFLKEFSNLKGNKILVHGGGKSATKLANDMQVEVEMINGRRVTNKETLSIITMVYAGKINKNIIAKLQAYNCNSIGFSGADGNSIVSVKRPKKEVDFGFVGDVVKVNTKTTKLLINNNITPVFCAITHDKNGQLLNTNADTIAAELAIAFSVDFEVELYYCFEKNGVLSDINDDNSVIEIIQTSDVKELIIKNIISEGMLPKINNSINAINNNVKKVCIGKPAMLFQNNIKYTTII